jgi:hypothetical protein
MKHAIILICLVFSLNADAQSQAERPNITLIMADDTTGDTMPKAPGQTG